MKKLCKNCVHYEVCQNCKMCSNYYPANGELDDYTIEEMIESGRQEFYDAWNLYISNYNN